MSRIALRLARVMLIGYGIKKYGKPDPVIAAVATSVSLSAWKEREKPLQLTDPVNADDRRATRSRLACILVELFAISMVNASLYAPSGYTVTNGVSHHRPD